MYEPGKGLSFDSDKFFDSNKFWYHIATNARPASSIWKKIQGKATTCDNVITRYAKTAQGTIAYQNGCYVKGQIKKSLNREGTLTAIDAAVPSRFQMTDAQTKKTSLYYIMFTDYETFAIITDGGATFWILSRTPWMCGAVLGKLEEKVEALGLDTSNVTVDFKTVKSCEGPAPGAAPATNAAQ